MGETLSTNEITADLAEIGARSHAVVSVIGRDEISGHDIETAMHINGGAIEFRVMSDPPRVFKVNLRQIRARALDTICQVIAEDAKALEEEDA